MLLIENLAGFCCELQSFAMRLTHGLWRLILHFLGALSSELYGSRLTVISPLAIMEISLVKLHLTENQRKIVKTQTTTEGD